MQNITIEVDLDQWKLNIAADELGTQDTEDNQVVEKAKTISDERATKFIHDFVYEMAYDYLS